MKLTKLGVFFILLSLNICHAQVKVIELDSISGSPREALPFDQAFILKIPTKSSRVTDVYFSSHVGKKSLAETFEYRLLTAKSAGRERSVKELKLSEISKQGFRVQQFGKQNYLLIEVSDSNLLDPGKTYTFFWAEDTDDRVMEIFDLYDKYQRNLKIYQNNKTITTALVKAKSDSAKAQKIYKELAKENEDKFGFQLGLPQSDSLKTIENAYYKRDSLFNKYSTLIDYEAKYNDRVSLSFPDTSIVTKTSFYSLMQIISQQSEDFDPKLKNVYLPDIRKAAQRISKLTNINSIEFRRLLNGLENLDCNACKPTESNQYESRMDNLKATLTAIEELYIVAEALRTSKPTLESAVVTLKAYRDNFQSFIKNDKLQNFESIIKVRKAIKDAIFKLAVSKLTKLGGSTHIYSFETRNKLSIAPDFGVVTTRIGQDGSNPYSFVPYLGFHINFRPINRDIPFWSYRHKPSHFTSLLLGWSLVSIDNGPKQSAGADSVSSFFSKGKGTLLSGLGIRLGNSVRFTGGTMWYFKYSPSNADPAFYDRRRLKAWLFVGLSLDLALKDLLNGITDVFSGAPRSFRPAAPVVVSD